MLSINVIKQKEQNNLLNSFKMKFQLEVPVLLPSEKVAIELMCMFYGYELIMSDEKKKYIVINDDDIAYIQKHEKRGIFIIWRKTEHIQYLKDLLAIAKQVKDYNFIPEEVTPDFEKSFIRRFKEFLNPTCKK